MKRRKKKKKLYWMILTLIGILVLLMAIISYTRITRSDSTSQSQSYSSTRTSAGESSTTISSTSLSNNSSTTKIVNLVAGDYSSIAGTWQNALGDTLVLSKQKLESGVVASYEITALTNSVEINENNYRAELQTTSNDKTFDFVLTQANHPIAQEVFADGFSDITDSSRDRIIICSFPISTETYKDSVLYKVAVAE